MKAYGKLVHFEIHRFRFILAGLMLTTALFQLSSLIVKLLNEVRLLRDTDALQRMNDGNVVPVKMTFSYVEMMFGLQKWYITPMFIAIAVLGFYVFFIWYRDWLG